MIALISGNVRVAIWVEKDFKSEIGRYAKYGTNTRLNNTKK